MCSVEGCSPFGSAMLAGEFQDSCVVGDKGSGGGIGEVVLLRWVCSVARSEWSEFSFLCF